jgi:hypothetical protein
VWQSLLQDKKLYSDQAGSSTDFTEGDNLLAVDSKIPRWLRTVKRSAVKLYVYIDDKNEDEDAFLVFIIGERSPSEHEHPLIILLHSSPNSSSEEALTRSLQTNTPRGGPITLDYRIWKKWLHTCSESHEKCRVSDQELRRFVPDRLIELSTEDDGHSFTWRLVCPANLSNVQYLTLSHCWGPSKPTSLTSESMSAHQKLSTFSRLPKSFRDAFFVTFSLGFRFIWIDSLCIIQDDPEDWTCQASMMGTIYKNARCNIAATWAENGNDGCFARESRTFKLEFGHGQSKDFEVQRIINYYDDLVEAPLNRRGWVKQERYLAKTQLSFAHTQVYWECQELIASEEYPEGIPKHLRNFSPYNQATPTGKPTLGLTPEADRPEAWSALVDFYSDCKSTEWSDRMIALAGLAEEMRIRTGDVYLAGLWKRDVHRQLCWSTDFDVRRDSDRFRVPFYLAPSWSWASVIGPVMSDQKYRHRARQEAWCIEVLNASVVSKHVTGLHSFVASNLVLQGIAAWAQIKQKCSGDDDNSYEKDDWILQFVRGADKSHRLLPVSMRVAIHWDEKMPELKIDPRRWQRLCKVRASDLLCMFIHTETNFGFVSGLLLRRSPETADGLTFVRMGTFTNHDGSLYDVLHAGFEVPHREAVVKDIDLDNAAYAGLVETITVV